MFDDVALKAYPHPPNPKSLLACTYQNKNCSTSAPCLNKENMLECEKSFNAQLDNAFEQSYQKTSLFVIDSAVSYPMLQILNSVLDEDVNRKSWIEDRNVFATISLNPSAEPWRSNFLDRCKFLLGYGRIPFSISDASNSFVVST